MRQLNFVVSGPKFTQFFSLRLKSKVVQNRAEQCVHKF